MRVKKDCQLPINWGFIPAPKIVAEYQEKYNALSEILDENPDILDLLDRDLQKLCSSNRKGRKGAYTSETILRTIVVMRIECLSFRDAIVNIAQNEFLCGFIRLGNRTMMDFTFLNKCANAIQSATWDEINKMLSRYAVAESLIDPSHTRLDTTAIEVNIHYPTDSSLLWDSYRVLVRWIDRAKEFVPVVRHHRFHDKRVKRLHLFITRYIASTSKSRQKAVKGRFRELIAAVRRVYDIAQKVVEWAKLFPAQIELAAIASELNYYLTAVKTVSDAAERVAVKGETVPASERIFSLFEQHAELIKRGKKGKPVEFGHMVLLVETREKFITQYNVMEKQIADEHLLPGALETHKEQFGEYPEVATADCRFHGTQEQMDAMSEKVEDLAIPKKAMDWANPFLLLWQGFRAGIEGSISVLKRAFGLLRCLYRGFKNFACAVGMSVFCHNLVCLARMRTA